MDWSKLNWSEIAYFCGEGNSFFSSSTFDLQLEAIVLMLSCYGIKQFTTEDVQALYRRLQIPMQKGTGIIKPSPGKIRKTAERLANLRLIENSCFEIIPAETGLYLPFDPSIYTSALEKGRREGQI